MSSGKTRLELEGKKGGLNETGASSVPTYEYVFHVSHDRGKRKGKPTSFRSEDEKERRSENGRDSSI